jgi:Uma2 family endonuclease
MYDLYYRVHRKELGMLDPSAAPPPMGTQFSEDEYCQIDVHYPDSKYEYEHGHIRPMSGGSIARDSIVFNVRMTLFQAFQSGPCSVHGSDVRIQVSEDVYYFPDITVTCDGADRRRNNKLIRSPRLVVEVLSPAMEHAQRSTKLEAYQACLTIQEIVFINQFAPYVEVYLRQSDQQWNHRCFEPDMPIWLESLDVEISFDEIYRGIDFDEPLE